MDLSSENLLKLCPSCKLLKPFSNFNKDNSRACGLQSWCRECQAPRRATWNEVNGRNHNLVQKYGITLEEKTNLLQAQDFKCANSRCRRPLVIVGNQEDKAAKRIAEVDHSHRTGIVRGLLCKNCNVAAGAINDSIELLSGLIEYLKEKEPLNGG